MKYWNIENTKYSVESIYATFFGSKESVVHRKQDWFWDTNMAAVSFFWTRIWPCVVMRKRSVPWNFLTAKSICIFDGWREIKTFFEGWQLTLRFRGWRLTPLRVDVRYTKLIYAAMARSIVRSLLCYFVRARDHCVLCDVTRDFLLGSLSNYDDNNNNNDDFKKTI